MSIASEIARIIQNIANSYDVCRENDATMPEVENSDNLAACINTMAGKGILEDIVARILDGENPIDLTELNEVEQYIASLIPRAISISKTITENGVYIAEDDGADGYGMVTVDVDTVNNDSLVVEPSITTQTFFPSGEYTGFGDVRVNRVTSSIDLNIKPENIKKGVSILGVTGTLEGGMDQETFNKLYPIGSIYINRSRTDCPLQGLYGSVWTKFPDGTILQQYGNFGGENHPIGQNISPGLPNIEGSFNVGSSYYIRVSNPTGAFSTTNKQSKTDRGGSDPGTYDRTAVFSAHDSNPIYGNSTTVQPPTHTVAIWQRNQ